MNTRVNNSYPISCKRNFCSKMTELSKNNKLVYHLKGATGTGCALMGLYGAINKQTALAALGTALAAFWLSTMSKK